MSFEVETASQEEMASTGGAYLNTPGKYHLTVLKVLDGQGPKGNAIEGFTVEGQVLAGTVNDQQEKLITITFWKPKLNGSEKAQAMDKKKITAFLVATNLVDPSQLGGKLSVDLEAAAGAQIIVDLVPQEVDGEKSDKFLQLNYANLYHVDDPEAANVPKNPQALAVIPPNHRHPAEWFAFKAKPEQAKGPSTPVASATRTAANYDDI